MGLIRNKELASQVIDYEGVMPPPLAPTDIDGIIEYKNKAYVIIEVKRNTKPIPTGQRIALERMANDFYKTGKDAIVLVVTHDTPQNEVIYAAGEFVREYYDPAVKKWLPTNKAVTLKEFVTKFLNGVG